MSLNSIWKAKSERAEKSWVPVGHWILYLTVVMDGLQACAHTEPWWKANKTTEFFKLNVKRLLRLPHDVITCRRCNELAVQAVQLFHSEPLITVPR